MLEKSIHFQTLDLTKFLMCSVDLNMGTISGTTHIKTIYSSLAGIGKNFTGTTLCISDDSVMQLIHILHNKEFLLQPPTLHPEEEIQRSQIWKMRGQEMEENCFACPCGNSFPVVWCTTSLQDRKFPELWLALKYRNSCRYLFKI